MIRVSLDPTALRQLALPTLLISLVLDLDAGETVSWPTERTTKLTATPTIERARFQRQKEDQAEHEKKRRANNTFSDAQKDLWSGRVACGTISEVHRKNLIFFDFARADAFSRRFSTIPSRTDNPMKFP